MLANIPNKIRQHNDVFSVYDVIKGVGDYKSGAERKAWERLTEEYPEVVTKCHNFKFPGRGQRKTPVATKKNMRYIIGLLPGAVGKKYREDAAELYHRYFEGDTTLAEEIIDRTDDIEGVKRIAKRAKGKIKRNFLTETIDRHVDNRDDLGRIIGATSNGTYKGIFKGTASQLKQQKGLAKKDNLRDHMTTHELSLLEFAEDITSEKIEEENIRNWKIPGRAEDIAKKLTEFVKNI